MKKFAAALLVFALLISSAVVWAESETTTDTGIWEKRAYVDEFDLPTDEYYISNKEPIVGKFSNSATTDSPLYVYIYVNDASYVSIKLIEYGSNIVKNPYSDGRDYDVAMMDTFGERYYFDGTMYSGYDQIFFTEEDSDTIIDALCENGTVRFAITETDNATTKYNFTIEDTTGFFNILPYNEIGAFSEGLAKVGKKGKYGFIDTNGDLVIPCKYDFVKSFSEGLAGVRIDGKWGFIDINDELIIPYKYDDVYHFSEGFALVENDGKYGFCDTTGNLVIPCEYDEAIFTNVMGLPFEIPLVRNNEDGKWGFLDTSNVSINYDIFQLFSDMLLPTNNNNQWGFCDPSTGNLVIPCEYDSANYFNEGLAGVEIDGKWGFINTNGELVISCKYDSIYSPFYQGLAVVVNDGIWSYIDTNGNFVIDYYEYGEGYFSGLEDGELIIISRDEVQPGWEEELAAYERELAEQEEARKAEAEAQRMLMEYTDEETIQSVQAALNEAGYDCGTPDGIAGKNTQAAISAFQKDNGLNETGTVTHELLLALNLIDGE